MNHRSILPACALALAATAAFADTSKDIAFENDAGIAVVLEDAGAAGADPARRLMDRIARMESELGAAMPNDAPQMESVGGHASAAVFRRSERAPDMIHVLLTTDANSAICHIAGAMNDRMQAALALGGEMMVARFNTYSFMPDGRFRIDGSVGASSSGEQSGVATTLRGDSAAAGRYMLDQHTLVLIFADGRQERHFFAYASKGTPPQLDPGMIFIGRDAFTSDD